MAKQEIRTRSNSAGIPEVLVYGEIDTTMAACFAEQIKELEQTNVEIHLRINSTGGSVYDGIAMYNTIKNSKANICGYIDGVAASMGSVFPLACSKLFMSKYAQMMTHKPSSGAIGTAEDMQQVVDQVKRIEPIMAQMYCAKTGLSEGDVYARFMNGKDNYFTAQQAKDAKLIDEIYDGEEVQYDITASHKDVYSKFQAKLTQDYNESQIIYIV